MNDALNMIPGNGSNGSNGSNSSIPETKKPKAKIKINGAIHVDPIIPEESEAPKKRTLDEAMSSLFTEFNIASFPKLSWQRIGATILVGFTIGYGVSTITGFALTLGLEALTLTTLSGGLLIGAMLFATALAIFIAVYATFKLVEISSNYILTGQIDLDISRVINKIKGWIPSVSISWNKKLIK